MGNVALAGGIQIVEFSSGRTTQLLAHPTYHLHHPHLLSVGRWHTFDAVSAGHSSVYVVRFRAEGPVPEGQWIAVTDGQTWDDKPRWSPDGDLLYHASDRDGFRCVWAQCLHPATKQPVGRRSPSTIRTARGAR
jgi:Tol biopolymer transport system component